MSAGLGAYRTVLADREARAFSLTGFVARLPISMTGIGIVLLVSLQTGSFGRAGLVAGVATAAGAVSAPLWGRAMDVVGQARVLVSASVVWTAGLALLVVGVEREWPLPVVLAAAVVTGLGFNSTGAAVRARWNHRLSARAARGEPSLLDTGFAVEAVLDEVIFLVGPVLVTVLATTVHPVAGLAVSVVLGVSGALALAALRGTEPPRQPRRHARSERSPLNFGALLPVVLASVALGAIFGGMEVVVVAYARERDILAYAGVFLTAWAAGSLVSGVVCGAVSWRRSAGSRFRYGALALACSLVPLPFVDAPLLVAALLAVSGVAIAPTLIASVAVTQAVVPTSRLTEALGWNSTGLAAGLAVGAATLGQLIDLGGSRLAFWGVVAAGALLVISGLAVRPLPRLLVRAGGEPPPNQLSPASPGTPPAPSTPGPAESPLR